MRDKMSHYTVAGVFLVSTKKTGLVYFKIFMGKFKLVCQ